MSDLQGDFPGHPIALVGMAGRFPGAGSVTQLWENMLAGREGVRAFRDEELDPSVPAELRQNPAYVKARGLLPDYDRFDSDFFGVSPMEAQVMDPQQRVLLELAYAALEDSGHRPGDLQRRVGVFVGANWNRYRSHCLDTRPDVVESYGDFATSLANEHDFLATRISHKLDLRGPSATVSTACSTSLVAIVQAARALLSGSCDLALAGGASVTVPTVAGHLHEPGSMLSRDGHCRPFDADCSGTTFSDGAAVVVLRRLEDALADGDEVHAVIRGFAVNNDGADKVSFSAPSVGGQAAVLRDAYAHAGVSPASVGYVEAHGTATPMGDPIEVAALARVFGTEGEACALGSVKSGVGHLVHAAGVTGFLMAALAVREGVVPPTLFFRTPNPGLRLDRTRFYVTPTARRWATQQHPRRAGVSSFGVGGTNAHVVLEQAPARPAPAADGTTGRELLLVSAKSPEALDARVASLRAHLTSRASASIALRDIAYTLHAGRQAHPHRAAYVMAEADRSGEWERNRTAARATNSKSVVFTFPGLGVERAGMAAVLHREDPAFRSALDHCIQVAHDACGIDLSRPLLHKDASAEMADLRIAKPALFAFEHALASSLWARGLRATTLVGCSLGEFACAAVAGVIALEDAFPLLHMSGARSADAPEGRLVTAYCTRAEFDAMGPSDVYVAAEHARDVLGLSGSPAAVDALVDRLRAAGIRVEALHGDRAFHSPLMRPCAEAVARHLADVPLHAPKLHMISGSLGRGLTDEEATDPGYWAGIVAAPIQYSRALDELQASDDCVLLEVGPGGSLTTLAMLHPLASQRTPVCSLPSGGFGEAQAEYLQAIGELWVSGADLEPPHRSQSTGRRVSLPTYPFARTRHWVDPGQRRVEAMSAAGRGEVTDRETVPDVNMAARLATVAEQVSGVELDASSEDSWSALDFDSLDLTQLAIALRREFEAEVTFRDLMERHTSPSALTDWLRAHAATPADAGAPPTSTEDAPDSSTEMEPRAGPTTRINKATDALEGLTAEQRSFVEQFTHDYAARTAASKASVQQNRARLADPRVVSGFDPAWKEIVYPIVTERSRGARLWDIDGNEYVDFTNGYGSIFFGHSPDFVTDAVRAQLDKGIEIGPQSVLTGEVAQLFCELTGNERAAFANTGSEAVMAALRVARTVTGRDKVVMFEGAYHGVNDEVIARPGPGGSCMPGAPGIPRSHVGEAIVLPYGEDDSLAQIEQLGPQLAAVLVEPVQSRRPALQPREFLHKLRAITSKHDSALILDEVVTGFRTHPAGIRALYEIDADMSTYGKVVGGGYPIGVLAGHRRFLDTLDGGMWQFGDDSVPEVGVTFFAGTFVRHPVALAAARAVLKRLIAAGPELQRERGERMTEMVAAMNAAMRELRAPVTVESFYSVAFMRIGSNQRWTSLIYAGLRHRGFHIWEGFPFFLTTSHTDEDLDAFVAALRDIVEELMAVGLLSPIPKEPRAEHPIPPVDGARLGRRPDGTVAWFVPDESRPGRYRELPASP